MVNFKKINKSKKIHTTKFVSLILVVCITFMSIGYSVFNENLMIDDITAVVRPTKDIRVTGVSASDFINQAMIDWVDYNVKSISSSVVLPQQDSTVTFKVQITNIGGTEMGILNITGLPDNLEYVLSDYHLKDKLCNENICNLGMQKYITITIKYKDGAVVNSNSQSIKLDFDFRPFHKVTYVDFDDGYTSDFPQEVLDGDTFKMALKQPYPVGAKPFIGGVGITYHYEGDTLVVENITEDLEIKSNYIQYIEDLVALSNKTAAANTYSGKTILMENSIDFLDTASYRNSNRTDFGDINGINSSESLIVEMTTGKGFKSIGYSTKGDNIYFSGTFDGKNHSISNLYIDNQVSSASVGLFGALNNATIKNLKLSGNLKTEVNANMGAISGRNYGTILIENIENHASVTGHGNSGSNGGILGSTNTNNGITAKITLKDSKNYGNISYGNQSAGIIGWTQGEIMIDNCHNYGTIIIDDVGLRAGGLVGAGESGEDDKPVEKLIINNSSNHGDVSSNGYAGGILGMASAVSNSVNSNYVIINSYNVGNISGAFAGGIVGEVTKYGLNIYLDVYNSVNLGNIVSINSSNSYNSACGILGYANNSNYFINFKNSYHSGIVSGYYNYGVSYLNSNSNFTLENVYYPNDQFETNYNQKYGLYTSDEMKNNSFLNLMNEYVTNHPSVDLLGNTYTLRNWVIGEDGYPIPDIG